MPLSSKSKDISYAFGETYLKYGSLGIKVYLATDKSRVNKVSSVPQNRRAFIKNVYSEAKKKVVKKPSLKKRILKKVPLKKKVVKKSSLEKKIKDKVLTDKKEKRKSFLEKKIKDKASFDKRVKKKISLENEISNKALSDEKVIKKVEKKKRIIKKPSKTIEKDVLNVVK